MSEARERTQLWMRAEIGAESPLWDAEGQMVELDQLPLEPTLRKQLGQWANVAWETGEMAVQERGLELLNQLRQQLVRQYEVIWDDN